MEFKESTLTFKKEGKFRDEFAGFVKEETARFSKDKTSSVSKMREMEQRLVVMSYQKDRKEVKEQKAELKSIKETSGKKSEAYKSKKKEVSKVQKAAATKVAVSNMLKARSDLAQDLEGNQVTGDALKDGSKGLMQLFIEFVNPMVYVKRYLGKIAAALAPYLLTFFNVAIVLIILVTMFCALMSPLEEIGTAMQHFFDMISIDSYSMTNTAMSDSEIAEILADAGASGSVPLTFALSRVGYPYSQELRASGSAYDCSSLMYYSYLESEVDLSYGSDYPPTAAAMCSMLEMDGKGLGLNGRDSLQSGDLIFYGGSANGRYKGIYHVAMYVGNGMSVEALNSRYGVVYRTLRSSNVISVCRP